MNKMLIFRIAMSAALLVVFYLAGLPIYFVILLGAFIIIMLLLRGHMYKRIELVLRHFFPSLSKLNPKVEKFIIIALFILVFILIKQGILLILKSAGVDVQKIMFDSLQGR